MPSSAQGKPKPPEWCEKHEGIASPYSAAYKEPCCEGNRLHFCFARGAEVPGEEIGLAPTGASALPAALHPPARSLLRAWDRSTGPSEAGELLWFSAQAQSGFLPVDFKGKIHYFK